MSLWLPRGYRAETDLEVKRSRFITTLARVDGEDAARAVVAEVRRAYPDARHHCSAFIVEVAGAQPVERSSDDGEPAGTAGTPMLDALRGAGVAQAVAVVTRYFGGTLLGTGGLVRAYSDAVTGALAAAGRVSPVRRPCYRLSVGHADFGRLQAELLDAGATVLDAAFGEQVAVVVSAPDGLDVAGLVGKSTRGTVVVEEGGVVVVEEPVAASD